MPRKINNRHPKIKCKICGDDGFIFTPGRNQYVGVFDPCKCRPVTNKLGEIKVKMHYPRTIIKEKPKSLISKLIKRFI